MNCILRTIRLYSQNPKCNISWARRERVSSELSILSPMILFSPQCEYNSSGTKKKSRDVQLSINAFDIKQKPTFCAVAQFTQTRTRLYPEPIVSLAPPSPARLSTKFDTFSSSSTDVLCVRSRYFLRYFFSVFLQFYQLCVFFFVQATKYSMHCA